MRKQRQMPTSNCYCFKWCPFWYVICIKTIQNNHFLILHIENYFIYFTAFVLSWFLFLFGRFGTTFEYSTSPVVSQSTNQWPYLGDIWHGMVVWYVGCWLVRSLSTWKSTRSILTSANMSACYKKRNIKMNRWRTITTRK